MTRSELKTIGKIALVAAAVTVAVNVFIEPAAKNAVGLKK